MKPTTNCQLVQADCSKTPFLLGGSQRLSSIVSRVFSPVFPEARTSVSATSFAFGLILCFGPDKVNRAFQLISSYDQNATVAEGQRGRLPSDRCTGAEYQLIALTSLKFLKVIRFARCVRLL